MSSRSLSFWFFDTVRRRSLSTLHCLMALLSAAADDLEALEAAVLPPDAEPPQVPPEAIYLWELIMTRCKLSINWFFLILSFPYISPYSSRNRSHFSFALLFSVWVSSCVESPKIIFWIVRVPCVEHSQNYAWDPVCRAWANSCLECQSNLCSELLVCQARPKLCLALLVCQTWQKVCLAKLYPASRHGNDSLQQSWR